jgi:hypothetical protein
MIGKDSGFGDFGIAIRTGERITRHARLRIGFEKERRGIVLWAFTGMMSLSRADVNEGEQRGKV